VEVTGTDPSRGRARPGAAQVEANRLQLEQVTREYRQFYEHSPTLKYRRPQLNEKLLPIRIRQVVHKQVLSELKAVERKIEDGREGRLALEHLKEERKKPEQDRFLLRHRIDATQVRSEVDGTVMTRKVEQSVGDRMQRWASILDVAALGKWQVKVSISQRDIPKVGIGREARIYLEAFPYTEFKVFSGRVTTFHLDK